MQYSDQEILQKISQPESLDRGFRLLMTAHQEKIYWAIRRMVNSHDDTDDIIQNTFIKAFRSIHLFEGRSSIYTWLYKIAMNETYTFKKARTAKATSNIEDQAYWLEAKDSDEFDGDGAVKKLEVAINQLPDKQKQVFNLRYYDEMSYSEMSTLLSTSEGALKASYHHALKKIESSLLS
jgi:RNA polymerase sigma-70 factor, ECF subfamily